MMMMIMAVMVRMIWWYGVDEDGDDDGDDDHCSIWR